MLNNCHRPTECGAGDSCRRCREIRVLAPGWAPDCGVGLGLGLATAATAVPASVTEVAARAPAPACTVAAAGGPAASAVAITGAAAAWAVAATGDAAACAVPTALMACVAMAWTVGWLGTLGPESPHAVSSARATRAPADESSVRANRLGRGRLVLVFLISISGMPHSVSLMPR